jgi:hypothetical protein
MAKISRVSRFGFTNKLGLRFHALLTEGVREVRFELVAVG